MEATVSTIGLRLLEEETLIGGSEDNTLYFITKLLENQTYPLKFCSYVLISNKEIKSPKFTYIRPMGGKFLPVNKPPNCVFQLW